LNELRADALTQLVVYGHLPDAGPLPAPVDIDTEHATIVPDVDLNTGDVRRDPHDPDAPPPPDRLKYWRTPPAPDQDDRSDRPDTTNAPHQQRADQEHQNRADEANGGDQTDRVDEANRSGQTSGADPANRADRADQSNRVDQADRPGQAGQAGQADRIDQTDRADRADETDETDRDDQSGWAHRHAGNPGTGTAVGSEGPDAVPVWGSRTGVRAHVQVTISLETLLGLDEAPGELAGHGPITANTARDLAFSHGSTWRRLVTDPITGYLLDYGRKTYRPPTALADHVRARDVTCRTPNCTRPAASCDLDHVISWPAGTTSEINLATECDHDHRLKHEGHWSHQVSADPAHPPGTIIMISPTGHVYLSYPYTYTDPWHRHLTEQATQQQNPPPTAPPPTSAPPDPPAPPANRSAPTSAPQAVPPKGWIPPDDDPGPPPF
jgi:hypothetical protein